MNEAQAVRRSGIGEEPGPTHVRHPDAHRQTTNDINEIDAHTVADHYRQPSSPARPPEAHSPNRQPDRPLPKVDWLRANPICDGSRWNAARQSAHAAHR